MRPVRSTLYFAFMLSAAMPPWLVSAQTVPPTGTTREEIERARIPQTPLAEGRGITVESDFERAPCPLADAKYKDITFELREAQFGGMRSVPAELVRPAYGDLIGKTVSVAEICEIRDRAATILDSNPWRKLSANRDNRVYIVNNEIWQAGEGLIAARGIVDDLRLVNAPIN